MLLSISFVFFFALPTAESFSSRATTIPHQHRHRLKTTPLHATGQGFGKDAPKRPSKTYENSIIRDVIDTEAAMSHFFSTREEWMPLFRWLAANPNCPAESFLGSPLLSELEFHEKTTPWKRLQGIPQNEDDRLVLASFLDQTQQALIEIPVNNSKEDDEDDIEFIEEGRRLLALQRFHVLRSTSVMDDDLFETCWNELAHLTQQDEEHTGSLILTPDCDLTDLRRFADMNLTRPLEWLGLDQYFEVSSFSRGSPAIRLFYKLNDMPTDTYHDNTEQQEEP